MNWQNYITADPWALALGQRIVSILGSRTDWAGQYQRCGRAYNPDATALL